MGKQKVIENQADEPKTLSQTMEIIHANSAQAMSNMPDRNDFCRFYTLCVVDANHGDDESYKFTFLFTSEGHKDMGTEDPTDDEYVVLHDISSSTDFDINDFKAEVTKLIEMYGAKHIHPIILGEYLTHFNIPEDYTMEHLYELLDKMHEPGFWNMDAGLGVCIIDEN